MAECGRDGCLGTIPAYKGRGRKPLYCGNPCARAVAEANSKKKNYLSTTTRGRGPYQTTIKHISAFDIAWVTGLFEGEGTIRPGKRTMQLRLGMVDLDVIERLPKITGVGKIYNYPLPSGKTVYIWAVGRKNDILHLLVSMVPLLSERRRGQVMEALDSSGVG